MIRERTSNELLQYFSKSIPGECKQLTYTLFRKKVEENPGLVRKFDDNVYFKKIHKFLVETGFQERYSSDRKQMLDNYERILGGKLGPITKISQNNSWQFRRSISACQGFRSSSEVYSDFEMEIMSTTINSPDTEKSLRNFVEEDLFISEQDLYDENLKGYADLSEPIIEFNDESFRPLDFSNGRMYK